METAGEKGEAPGSTKFDVGKDRWDLAPWDAFAAVVRVMGYGAQKYAEHGWVSVPRGRERYFAALHRHLHAWWTGEKIDSESGLPHIWLVATNACFLASLEMRTLHVSVPQGTDGGRPWVIT